MLTRREFLSRAGIGLASVALASPRAYSGEDDEFVFVKDGIPDEFVRHGSIGSPTNDLLVVSFPHLIVETEEYEEIVEEGLDKGTAKYWTLFNRANTRAQGWIDDYAREGDVIIDRTYVDQTDVKMEDVFLEVPEIYKSDSLLGIVNELDYTSDVLRRYDK